MQLYQPTITGSLAVSGSVIVNGTVTATSFSGLLTGTASLATTASFALNAQTASYVLNAVSSSNAATASSADNLLVRNTLTAQTLVVQTITSSVDFVTGSTRFGSILGNTHQFTGSVNMTGSLTVTTTGTELQVNANGVNLGNALTDSHVISGSLRVNPNGLFVSSSGFIGMGTTNPSAKLEVNVGLNSLKISGRDTYVDSTEDPTNANIYVTQAGVGDFSQLAGNLVLQARTQGTVYRDIIFAGGLTNGDALMTILGEGNVGIGTTSPSTLLHINGSSATLTIADNTSYAAGVGGKLSLHGNYRSVGDITEGGYIKISKTNSTNGDYGFDMIFATSNYTAGVAERLRITSTGAATFSSSVTATQFTSQGGRGTSYGYKFPDWQIYNTTSGNALAFTNYTTDFLTISSTGNVNIGSATAASYGLLGSSNLSTNMGITFHNGSTYSKVGGVVSVQESAGSHALSFWARSGGDEGEKMRISSTGNILINQTSALAGVPTSIEMSGVGSGTPSLQASYNVYANHGAANTTWRGYYVFHRSRGTTTGSVTAVAADDFLGTLRWNGADGSGFVIGAEINAMVDGTVGTNDMPTRLTFSTTADGGSSPTERLRITNSGQVRVIGVGNSLAFDTDGSGASTTLATNGLYDFRIYNGRGGASNIDVSTYSIVFGTNGSTSRYAMETGRLIPLADNSYTMGASGYRWSAIWSANGTIQTSDARQKKDITPTNLGLNFIMALNPVSYKWKVGKNVVTSDGERIDENGATQSNDIITPVEGTRTHYGLIAQEVKEALGDVDFGGYVHDEETDTLALRYDQFISPLIKAIQELKAEFDEYKTTHP